MRHEESKLQIAAVRWFDLTYPKFKLNLFSIPNEGSRTPANGARMKAQGRRAGCADIFFAYPNPSNGYHGAFIEFKTDKGKQNENQLAFQKAVEAQGYRYEIVRDFDSFKTLIENYLS